MNKKTKCIAYLRVSTKDQDVSSQQGLIERYATYQQLNIDEWITLEISSRKDEEARRIDELKNLQAGDVLITTELSRLGRSTVEVIQLVNHLVKSNVRVIIINQGIDNKNGDKLEPAQKLLLGIFSSLAEMERDLISQRTKAGLQTARAKGNIGGRRAGTFFKSKYDKHLPKIKEMLSRNLSLESILKIIGEGKSKSLANYLAKRGIRTKTKS